MRFNALIATYQRCDLLSRTLDSLAQTDRPEGFEHIYVIENGSDAGARQTCKEFASRLPVVYVHVEKAGKSAALQQVIDQLKTGFIVFLDDDIRVNRELFTSYAEAVHRHGEGHFFGGPLLVDYEQPPLPWLLGRLPASVIGWEPENPENPLERSMFLGANFGVFAQDVSAVGGLNTALGPGSMQAGTEGNPVGQDFDIQRRLLAAGRRPIYIPNAKVWHYVPQERCAPQWTLHRWYRISMGRAMKDQSLDHAATLFGYPRCLLPRAIRFAANSALASLFPNERTRFEMRLPYYEHCGLMAGYRRRREMAKKL